VIVSAKGRRFVEEHEGLRLRPYKAHPSETYWTVGYGHYGPDVRPGRTYTLTECRAFLRGDLKEVVLAVQEALMGNRNIKQQEIDALASLGYNLGSGVLTDFNFSTLAARLMSSEGRYFNARCRIYRMEFPKWVKAGNVVLPGLVERRADEVRLACRGIY
jgi:GH24 family phage-related lysozyme (muramidase)